VYTLGNLLQESGGDLLVRGVLLQVDGNEELLSLLVDITDIDTTLVGEEDPVTLSGQVSGEIGNRLTRWRRC
jgi:hypothetical protein